MTMALDRGRRTARYLAVASIIEIAVCLMAPLANGQTQSCRVAKRTKPPGQVISCSDGLVIRAERSSVFELIDQDGRIGSATLDARGLLIELPPDRGGFQILTPHAIAAVRGTVWAVDVTPRSSTVFVQSGSVRVTRREGGEGETATLQAGDGISVEAGRGPLIVERWEPKRIAALLARFRR